MRFVQVVQLYNSADMATARKNSHFVLSERSGFYLITNRPKTIYAFRDIAFSRWDIVTTAHKHGWFLYVVHFCPLVQVVTFYAKSPLYIYIRYIWFGLVGFYGISAIVGYLMPNPLYTYILNIYDLVWLGFMAYQPL